MRILVIGLGLGGQTVADVLLTEQRRFMAHAMIYELMRLPLADPSAEDERIYVSEVKEGKIVMGIPKRKIELAEGIAMWSLFDDSSISELEKVREEERPERVLDIMGDLRRWVEREASLLSEEDRDDILGFFELVKELKYPRLYEGSLENWFIETLDRISNEVRFIWSMAINSSRMDLEQLRGRENTMVTVGLTPPILGRRRAVSVRRFYPMDWERDILLIGEHITRGGGAGWDNTLGLRMAVDDEEVIEKMISRKIKDLEKEGTTPDMILIIYASGGGTGSGAAPVAAKVAKEVAPDSRIMAIAMTPIPEECRMRAYNSVTSLAFISEFVDGLGLISLEDYMTSGMSTDEVYRIVDNAISRFILTLAAAEELNIVRSTIRERLLSEIERKARREGVI
ncbi:MAG: hypothetical protein QI197_04630 [Candidatus Korarchaeota archaeon]|nr:hypothetical protein [Candidatus Korarchaeota archaeon]